jgi:hypothetical protein
VNACYVYNAFQLNIEVIQIKSIGIKLDVSKGEASTSAAAAFVGASNLLVADSPAEPKRQGRPPMTAKQLNKFPIDYSWW